MRNLLFLPAVLTILLFSLVAAQAGDDYASWDFGKAREGDILKHVFVFKNSSRKPLKIKSVRASCGCTDSRTDKEALLPSETANIEVVFKSRGYRGAVKQFVYVETDNRDIPLARLSILADVGKENK